MIKAEIDKIGSYKIKKIQMSFAECGKCDLVDEASCILETNCEKDLSKVDLMVIAENPGKDEVKQGVPLIGRAGQTFRKYFERNELHKMNYLLTNVVLCQTIDHDTGNTINPTDETTDLCKINCFTMIDMCRPKLIVLMGATAGRAFGVLGKDTKGITAMRGQIYDWEYKGITHKIFLTLHPSYVNRNRVSAEPIYDQDFVNVKNILSGKSVVEYQADHSALKKVSEGKPFYYKIPEKFYTDDFRLVDVQQMTRDNKIMYIFRDKNNQKHYHYKDMSYYFYLPKKGVKTRKIVPYTELDAYVVNYKDTDHIEKHLAYEGDLKLPSKHTIDYYLQNQGECRQTHNNIFFMDIEVDAGLKNKSFPKAEQALYPFSMIGSKFNGKKIVHVVDNKTAEIKQGKDYEVRIFSDEKSMMMAFIKYMHECDPDLIAGWNLIAYDLQYIFNRLPQLGMSQGSFSRTGIFYVDAANFRATMPGCICVDQDYLYKMFTFTQRENYKLGNIASVELGASKVELPYAINEMYWKDINLTIEYNMQDVELLDMLEKKLGHINLLNEIREICQTTGSSAMSTFGQVDTILVSYLKRNGNASKNADEDTEKGKFAGAFVREPIPGIYSWATDFDFTSLYPSIIMTYNIGPNSLVMRFRDKTLGYNFIYRKNLLPDEFEVVLDPTFESKVVVFKKEDFIKNVEENNLVYTINGCFYLPHTNTHSVFSEIVSFLLDSRKVYKKKMLEAKESGNNEDTSFFNTKQLVYKTIANSLYGVIGNKIFRFFNLSIAESITASGQEALKACIIYGDKKMESLKNGVEMEQPKPLTKAEMYGDNMPDRITPFIITGDTDSIFCCFEEFENINIETIQQHCDTIQNYLNNVVIGEIIKKHNGNSDFNRLELKNELIIAKGLFLAKKRYVIHVVRQEGKVIDDVVGMGLETKRSDFPKKTKEFLNELIDMILKSNASIRDLLKFIDIKRGEFLELVNNGDKTISKPAAWVKKISEYKNIPQNVRAMVNWNDLVYDIHVPGTRSYLFKIKGIDLDIAPPDVVKNYREKFQSKNRKLDVIAIPDEEAGLPKYLIPDRDAIMKFIFEDRHEHLMAPFVRNNSPRKGRNPNMPMLL